MTAILGGSGSGKSTLMETVLARGISTRARVEGAIEVRVGAAGEQQPGRSITSLRALHRVRNLVGASSARGSQGRPRSYPRHSRGGEAPPHPPSAPPSAAIAARPGPPRAAPD